MVHDPHPGASLREVMAANPYRQLVVLFDGLPLAGVTRTMVEVAQAALPQAQAIMLKPADLVAKAFAGAFDGLFPYRSYVVLLDDLSPAELVLLDREVLDIITVHATVVMNINSRWRHRLLDNPSPVTAGARDIIENYAYRQHVTFALPAEQRRHAQARMPDLPLGVSIAESLVGGDAILNHYDRAAHAFPAARALAEVAVDIRRIGVHRGLTQRELFNVYAQTTKLGWSGRHEFAQAFDWITTPPSGARRAILKRVDQDLWTAQNYLAGADDGDHNHPVRELRDDRWRILLNELQPTDAFNAAVAALLRGHYDVARDGFRRAERCGDAVLQIQAFRAADHLRR